MASSRMGLLSDFFSLSAVIWHFLLWYESFVLGFSFVIWVFRLYQSFTFLYLLSCIIFLVFDIYSISIQSFLIIFGETWFYIFISDFIFIYPTDLWRVVLILLNHICNQLLFYLVALVFMPPVFVEHSIMLKSLNHYRLTLFAEIILKISLKFLHLLMLN